MTRSDRIFLALGILACVAPFAAIGSMLTYEHHQRNQPDRTVHITSVSTHEQCVGKGCTRSFTVWDAVDKSGREYSGEGNVGRQLDGGARKCTTVGHTDDLRSCHS